MTKNKYLSKKEELVKDYNENYVLPARISKVVFAGSIIGTAYSLVKGDYVPFISFGLVAGISTVAMKGYDIRRDQRKETMRSEMKEYIREEKNKEQLEDIEKNDAKKLSLNK